MRYRTLGRTGLEISELVFGGGKVGGLLIFQDDETKRAAIRMALDGGINWIDTAPLYGDGKSEEALGWLLKEIDDTPYLSTKVGLDPDRLDDIPGEIERSVPSPTPAAGAPSPWTTSWPGMPRRTAWSVCATRVSPASSASPPWARRGTAAR
jgi:aryl-alcohol dehydrogenase-like predicted oxidoreductase